jgi:transposase-like protein
MGQKIRKAMGDRDASYQLLGLIEMDDGYFGSKKPGKRGRGAVDRQVVVVAVEDRIRKPGYASMEVVKTIDKETVNDMASRNIKEEQTIKTDGYRSYNGLARNGFKHHKVILRDPKKASELLPWVHILISNAKSFLSGCHHWISKKHLQRYLDEFCYKFNRRFWEHQILNRLLKACLSTSTITFAELTA